MAAAATRGRDGEKVLVAVDLANIYCQVKSVHGGDSVTGNYKELVNELVGPEDDATLLCFAPIPNPVEDLQGYANTVGMHNFLRHIGYIVHTIERRNGKANGDVLLAVKTMEALAASCYDKVVIVSADGDFYPLFIHARERGIKAVVASIDSAISVRLKQDSDEIIDLTDWAMSIVDKNGNISTVRDGSCNKKPLDDLESTFNNFNLNFDDESVRRDNFFRLMTSIAVAITSMNSKDMKVHRSILITLKECMETFNPSTMGKENLSLMAKVVRQMRRKDPSIDLCNEMRNKFIVRCTTI